MDLTVESVPAPDDHPARLPPMQLATERDGSGADRLTDEFQGGSVFLVRYRCVHPVIRPNVLRPASLLLGAGF